MEYKLNRESLPACETVYDGCAEQPIDLDFSLPDYCPDIQKILKCQVTPSVTAQNLMGDRLEVEGTVTIRVLYLDASGENIRCCENNHPFTASIAIRQPADNAVAFTKTRVEYVNCRATSPRRLDIHGAFSVCARVIRQVQDEIVSRIEGDDIQQKTRTLDVSRSAGLAQQQFSVTEVLEIGGGKPPAETIVRSGVTASVQDFKVVSNKLILRGEAILRVLYSPGIDSPALEAMEYEIPFSQMIDCAGVTEECTCDVALDVMNYRVEAKSDSSGENTLLETEIKLMATACAWQDAQITAVTDAYSTQYELSADYRQRAFERLSGILSDTSAQKYTMEFDSSGVSRIIDLWNEVSTVAAEIQDKQISYKGRLNVCLLALTAEGKPFYQERMFDYAFARDYAGGSAAVRCDPRVSVQDVSYRITGAASLEVKVELRLASSVFEQASCRAVADISADEEHPREKDTSAALTIYYADPSESLWDIARMYCTSADAIREENGLAEDFIPENGMLLIPM